MTKVTYIDPPNGWRYGFPKYIEVSIEDLKDIDMKKWLVENGYPQIEIDDCIKEDDKFHFQLWEEELKDVSRYKAGKII